MDELAIKILGGLVRAGIAAAGGWALNKGLVDGDTVTQVMGSAGVIAAGLWSMAQKAWAKKDKATAVVKAIKTTQTEGPEAALAQAAGAPSK